ncbi:hypothetical protein J4E93_007902 [Alternaria ventricosa]|uniref:uncharacterized protein n=1 Tax=Alternaria ventricosa TaxID=1187951 RepID=UPI0020C4B8F1|nr:uncharacterized protein J4E93_007902 [Alternaria ventricosa]KAI4641803.1 hypothetical protein J4E93_007902 [Alternaria ventricosa]
MAIIYIFLVERIHVVRAPFVNRRKDKIYLCCMAMIVVLYSTVAINAYLNHVTELHESDGRCHFGIRGIASIPFTVVNFFTNIILTVVFFYLLYPVVGLPCASTLSRMFKRKSDQIEDAVHGGQDTPARKNIKTLLWKSIIGSLLIEIPTAANMVQFFLTRGEELGMICLTICLVDVCWDALIIHWLTFSSSASAAEKDLSRSTLVSKEELDLIPGRTLSPSKSRDDGKTNTQFTAEKPTDANLAAFDFSCEGARDSTTELIRPAPVKQ